MPLMCPVWPVVAGLLAAVLVTTAGCPSTAEKPDAAPPPASTPPASATQASPPQASTSQLAREVTAQPQVPPSKASPAAEPPTMSKLPVAEFQHLPAAPPSEPLPKPTQEAMDSPAAESAAEPSAAANARPMEMPNPLRGAEQAPVRPAPLVASAASAPSAPPAPSAAPPVPSIPPSPSTPQPAPSAAPAPFPPSTPPLTSPPPSAPQTASPAAPPPKEAGQPPAGRPKTNKNSGIPFDPIKVNGSIFDGWAKPKLALVITGMEAGYLEPCGCAGLDRMKGGMARRAAFFQQLRQEYGWPVLGLDVGGLIQGFGRQAELKFQTLVESKRKMGYEALTFGADDLRLPAGELVAVAASVDGKPSPFLTANVGLLGKPGEIIPQTRITEAAGLKIGVTAVLGKKYQKEIHNDEIEMSDPDAILAKIVPALKPKVDYLVLLAHATLDEAEELGKKFPAFNVVVSSEGWEEPPKQSQTIAGTKTLLITVGHKGMDVIVLGLYDGASPTVRYQRVPLDSRFKSLADMKLLMTAYQEQLKAIGFAGLGLRPVPHPLLARNGRFVGSQKCESCHEKSYDIWKKSGHAHAYNTIAKLDPPRNFDPECVSCHVVGWHPTKFFPYETGYQSQEQTPHLVNVGCEDCHGPGEKHVAAEMSGSEALRAQLRKAMVITKAEAKKQQCLSCHDLDNSPEFNFDLYWPFIEHHEKE